MLNMTTDATRKPRVLVVEGDPALRLLMSKILIDADWAPHVSDDGECALEAVRTGDKFDAVIFDVQTAAIEPRTFVRRLRRATPDTRVAYIRAPHKVY